MNEEVKTVGGLTPDPKRETTFSKLSPEVQAVLTDMALQPCPNKHCSGSLDQIMEGENGFGYHWVFCVACSTSGPHCLERTAGKIKWNDLPRFDRDGGVTKEPVRDSDAESVDVGFSQDRAPEGGTCNLCLSCKWNYQLGSGVCEDIDPQVNGKMVLRVSGCNLFDDVQF